MLRFSKIMRLTSRVCFQPKQKNDGATNLVSKMELNEYNRVRGCVWSFAEARHDTICFSNMLRLKIKFYNFETFLIIFCRKMIFQTLILFRKFLISTWHLKNVHGYVTWISTLSKYIFFKIGEILNLKFSFSIFRTSTVLILIELTEPKMELIFWCRRKALC